MVPGATPVTVTEAPVFALIVATSALPISHSVSAEKPDGVAVAVTFCVAVPTMSMDMSSSARAVGEAATTFTMAMTSCPPFLAFSQVVPGATPVTVTDAPEAALSVATDSSPISHSVKADSVLGVAVAFTV